MNYLRQNIFLKIDKERNKQIEKRHTINQDESYKKNELIKAAINRLSEATQYDKHKVYSSYLSQKSLKNWFSRRKYRGDMIIQAIALLVAELEANHKGYITENCIVQIDEHYVEITYDKDLKMYKGRFYLIPECTVFFGKTPNEVLAEGKKSLEVYKTMCKEKGLLF